MQKNNTVLCLLAHPDDAEYQCAGTLALLSRIGWQIHIATMTPGQAGSVEKGPEEISAIRREEATKAANLIKGTYHCLECEDIFILYNRPTLLKVIELIRRVKPTIVFTASPSDYIVDHEITSKVARTGCLAAGINNISIDGTEPFSPVPYLYYCEPMQGKNILGDNIESTTYVDISSSIDLKKKMLESHESQREWLQDISEVDEYVTLMLEYAKKVGQKINSDYAEGFRQHLGFSYPTNNILLEELSDFVNIMNNT